MQLVVFDLSLLMKTEHPFYCEKKKCRKTVWDTPEYLNQEDKSFLNELCCALRSKDREAFDKILTRKGWFSEEYKSFFNKMIGWPEGISYYRDCQSDFYFNGFISNERLINFRA